MSGIASIGLLFWATIWPPPQDQAKAIVFAVSAICFVIGSYRIWAKEHQRWRDLTAKTREEFFADTISEFNKLERWYGSDECTTRRPLDHNGYLKPAAIRAIKPGPKRAYFVLQ